MGYGEAIGYSGSGSITQIGGTNVIPALISGGEYALNIGPLAGSTGNYNLSGGSLSMQSGVELIGYFGTGTFTQSGGTNTATPQLLGALPLVIGAGSGGMGTYSLSAGSLVAGSEAVGNGGTGVFLQSGGTNTIPSGGELDIGVGYGGGGVGTYTLSGGVANVAGNVYVGGTSSGVGIGAVSALNVNQNNGSSLFTISGTLKVYPGNTLSLSSGEIQTGSLDLSGIYSDFTWSGGTLELTNTNVVLDSAAVAPPIRSVPRWLSAVSKH